MKVKTLKIIRIACLIPFIWLVIMAFIWSWTGISGFTNSMFYGPIAFVFILLAYASKYYWIGIICLCIIIATSLQLKKQRNSELKKDGASAIFEREKGKINVAHVLLAFRKKAIIGVGIFLFTFFVFELISMSFYNREMIFQGNPGLVEVIQNKWHDPSMIRNNFLITPIGYSIGSTSIYCCILLVKYLYKIIK